MGADGEGGLRELRMGEINKYLSLFIRLFQKMKTVYSFIVFIRVVLDFHAC